MKKCAKCGASYNDDVKVCSACGASLDYVKDAPESVINNQALLQKTDNNAKLFGILSIVFAPTFIVGLILGIIGAKKSLIKSDKVLNIVGICLSILTLLIVVGYIIFVLWLTIGVIGSATQGTVDAIVGAK